MLISFPSVIIYCYTMLKFSGKMRNQSKNLIERIISFRLSGRIVMFKVQNESTAVVKRSDDGNGNLNCSVNKSCELYLILTLFRFSFYPENITNCNI